VEIIGNSNEPAKIVTHLGKMFSALTAIDIGLPSDDSPAVFSSTMQSKEGEVVPFIAPVNISVGVKDWLGTVESQMRLTLATGLENALAAMPSADENSSLLSWIERFPAQVIILSSQVSWSQSSDSSLSSNGGKELPKVLQALEGRLRALSESVLQDMDSALRKKCEQLLTEMVHQRDVSRLLVSGQVSSPSDFGWLYHLRFYWAPKEADLMKRLCIKMSNAQFFYGFEYLGIGERLVQTPLTDRCYLTLTQALHFRMGGNPFGPGKDS
jgi:dynein heavy chain 1, cytosolic